jgi:hypothetical protein
VKCTGNESDGTLPSVPVIRTESSGEEGQRTEDKGICIRLIPEFDI